MSTTERGRRSSARSSSSTRFFVTWKSHVVNLERSEARQALVDAEEDLLRQILGERAVSDQPQDVVVDRHLVGADDDREGAFITTLCLPQDPEVRLWQRQVAS